MSDSASRRVIFMVPGLGAILVVLGSCAEAVPPTEVAAVRVDSVTCIGQPCGEPCQYCERGDPECLQAQTGFCDGSGECKPPPVSCEPHEPGDDTSS